MAEELTHNGHIKCDRYLKLKLQSWMQNY